MHSNVKSTADFYLLIIVTLTLDAQRVTIPSFFRHFWFSYETMSLFLCLHDLQLSWMHKNMVGRHYVFRLPTCPSFPFSWTQYLRNALRALLSNWHKRLFGLKNEQIQFWWLKIKDQGHCDFTSVTFLSMTYMTWYAFNLQLDWMAGEYCTTVRQ